LLRLTMSEVKAEAPTNSTDTLETSDKGLSREERFKALRSRLAASNKANHDEVIAEHKRMKINPAHLTKLDRKKAEAEMKLAKQDAEDAGEDFERKRAWDWTMEESLAWDRRLAEKKENRDKAGFSDYTQLAEKGYRQDLKGLKPNMEEYKKAREDALAKGQLVQTENGEIVAVDEDRRFYADANTIGIRDHKPTKEALDRLVDEVKKKYENLGRMVILTYRDADKEAKRRKKRENGDNDISYINKRNKVFNEKLSRYDYYETCVDIGTMINIQGKQGRLSNEAAGCNTLTRRYPSRYAITMRLLYIRAFHPQLKLV